MAFFTRAAGSCSAVPAPASEHAASQGKEPAQGPCRAEIVETTLDAQKVDGGELDASGGGSRAGNNQDKNKPSNEAAAAEWGKILSMKKPSRSTRSVAPPKYLSQKEQRAFLATASEAPLCPGHGEPAIQRLVQKGGPNRGRRFWVSILESVSCRRAGRRTRGAASVEPERREKRIAAMLWGCGCLGEES